jgi:hypothetical protein
MKKLARLRVRATNSADKPVTAMLKRPLGLFQEGLTSAGGIAPLPQD